MKLKSLLILLAAALMVVASGCKKDEFKNLELKFTQGTVQLEEGGDISLKKLLVINPQNLDTIKVQWAVADPEVAEISKNGFLTGLSEGTTTVTASAHGKSATIGVEVRILDIKELTIPESYSDVYVNMPFALTDIVVVPQGINLKRLNWSDKSGNVSFGWNQEEHLWYATAKECGDFDVTITESSIEPRTTTLSVKVKTIKDIKLSQDGFIELLSTGTERRTAELTYTIEPEDATYKDVEWSVSPSGIINFDNGKISTVEGKEGNVVIKALHKAVNECDKERSSSSCMIIVSKAPKLESFELELSSQSVYTGKSITAKIVNVKPAGAQVDNVNWSLSDKTLASLSATTGTSVTLTAKNTKDTKVTLTAMSPKTGYFQEVEIPLYIVGVTSISFESSLDKKTVVGFDGLKYRIAKPTVKPADATSPNVTYSSTPSGIIVGEYGDNVEFTIPTVTSLTQYTLTATAGGKSTYIKFNVVPDDYLANLVKTSTVIRYGCLGMNGSIKLADLCKSTSELESEFTLNFDAISHGSSGKGITMFETYTEDQMLTGPVSYSYNKVSDGSKYYSTVSLYMNLKDFKGYYQTSPIVKFKLYSSLIKYTYSVSTGGGVEVDIQDGGTVKTLPGAGVTFYAYYYEGSIEKRVQVANVKADASHTAGTTMDVKVYGSDKTKSKTGSAIFHINWKNY